MDDNANKDPSEEKRAPHKPEPHPGQQRILDLKGRYRVAVCGRRFGKTIVAAIAAVERCQDHGHQRVWWISPIQEQSDRVEREIAVWLAQYMKKRGAKPEDQVSKNGKAYEWEHRKSEHALVCVSNGSRIEFHSAQSPDHLRGAGLDLLIVDEAADVSEYTWKSVLKPMLLDSGGEAFILGTPRGTGNWLHRVYILGQQEPGEKPTYTSVRMPTSDNPEIKAEDLQSFRAEMTDDEFRQEFLAEFLDGVGAVFRNVDGVVDDKPYLLNGRPGERYITGVDLGDRQDFTVLCSMSVRSWRMDGFWRFNNLGWCDQVDRIVDHLKIFPGHCVVDATGAGRPVHDMLRQRLNGALHPFIFTSESKRNIVRALQIGFEKKRFALPKIEVLLNELRAFEATQVGEHLSFAAPTGLHDDCVMALALAYFDMAANAQRSGSADNPIREGFFGQPPSNLLESSSFS